MTNILFTIFSGFGFICLIIKLFISEFFLDEILEEATDKAMDFDDEDDDDDEDFKLKLSKYYICRKAFNALAWFFLVGSIVIYVLGKAVGVM